MEMQQQNFTEEKNDQQGRLVLLFCFYGRGQAR